MSTPETTSGTRADDGFHEPAVADPHWTETCWFSFFVPERRLSGTLYPLFRPNLGVCTSGVYVWDDSAHEPWNALYGRNLWHLPMPESDLVDLSLPSGLAYRCLEPGRRFELRYDDGDDLHLHLEFEGVVEPHYIGDAHLDQHGRVRGSLSIGGQETINVDCFGIRDRSWSVRSDLADHIMGTAGNGAYCYGMVSPDEGFQAIGMEIDGECRFVVGYLIRDGRLADLVTGQRRVLERQGDWPIRVSVEIEDALGRQFEAEGECVNRLAWQFTPNLFSWNSLTEWRFGDATGWGEDHDNWTIGAWRRGRKP